MVESMWTPFYIPSVDNMMVIWFIDYNLSLRGVDYTALS
jgi:hypothetical protein